MSIFQRISWIVFWSFFIGVVGTCSHGIYTDPCDGRAGRLLELRECITHPSCQLSSEELDLWLKHGRCLKDPVYNGRYD